MQATASTKSNGKIQRHAERNEYRDSDDTHETNTHCSSCRWWEYDKINYAHISHGERAPTPTHTHTNATLHWKTQYQRYRIRTRNRVTTETKSKWNGFRFSCCSFWRLVLLLCVQSPNAISMQCAVRLYSINSVFITLIFINIVSIIICCCCCCCGAWK